MRRYYDGALASKDPACNRLMSVPGIGPIISSAMVAAIGSGDVFARPLLPQLARADEVRYPPTVSDIEGSRNCDRVGPFISDA
jgi:transposase